MVIAPPVANEAPLVVAGRCHATVAEKHRADQPLGRPRVADADAPVATQELPTRQHIAAAVQHGVAQPVSFQHPQAGLQDGQLGHPAQVDAHARPVQTDLASLRLLRDPSQLTRLIKADALHIDGDIQVAQQYSHFFQQLNPDWQQALSGYVGDAPAHKIARSLQQAHAYFSNKAEALGQMSTELAQDELNISPAPAELAQFSDAVSQLSARVDKLQQQLNALQES